MNYKLIKKNRLFIFSLFLVLILGYILRAKLAFFSDVKYYFSQNEFNDFLLAGYKDSYKFDENLFNILKNSFFSGGSYLYTLAIYWLMRVADNIYTLRVISILPNILSLTASIFLTKKLCDLFSTKADICKALILFTAIIHCCMYKNIIDAIKVSPDSLCYFLVLLVYIFVLSYLKKPSWAYAVSIFILALIIASFKSVLALTLLPILIFLSFHTMGNEDYKKERILFRCSLIPLIYLVFRIPDFVSLDQLGNSFFNLFQEFFASPFLKINATVFMLLYVYGTISYIIKRRLDLFSLSFLPMLSLVFDSSSLLIARFLPSILIGIFYIFIQTQEKEKSFLVKGLISILMILFLINQGFFTIPVKYYDKFFKAQKEQYPFDLQRNSDILFFLHHDITRNDMVLMDEDLRRSFYKTVPLMRLNKTLLCKDDSKCFKENKVLDLGSLKNSVCVYNLSNNENSLEECISSYGNKPSLIIVSKNLEDEKLILSSIISKKNYKVVRKTYLKDWYNLKFIK